MLRELIYALKQKNHEVAKTILANNYIYAYTQEDLEWAKESLTSLFQDPLDEADLNFLFYREELQDSEEFRPENEKNLIYSLESAIHHHVDTPDILYALLMAGMDPITLARCLRDQRIEIISKLMPKLSEGLVNDNIRYPIDCDGITRDLFSFIVKNLENNGLTDKSNYKNVKYLLVDNNQVDNNQPEYNMFQTIVNTLALYISSDVQQLDESPEVLAKYVKLIQELLFLYTIYFAAYQEQNFSNFSNLVIFLNFMFLDRVLSQSVKFINDPIMRLRTHPLYNRPNHQDVVDNYSYKDKSDTFLTTFKQRHQNNGNMPFWIEALAEQNNQEEGQNPVLQPRL